MGAAAGLAVEAGLAAAAGLVAGTPAAPGVAEGSLAEVQATAVSATATRPCRASGWRLIMDTRSWAAPVRRLGKSLGACPSV